MNVNFGAVCGWKAARNPPNPPRGVVDVVPAVVVVVLVCICRIEQGGDQFLLLPGLRLLRHLPG